VVKSSKEEIIFMIKTPYALGRRNLNIKDTHWEELTSDYKITKPTVICLGGNNTRFAKQANHMCKIAQNLIGLKPRISEDEELTSDDVDLIGIAYGVESELFRGQIMQSSSSGLTNMERQEIAKLLFLPLISDGNGNRLGLKEACKNCSLITFFSHCHGATEANGLIGKLDCSMYHMGYSEKERVAILSQITSVSYAPALNIPYVQRLDIKSFRDNYFDYPMEFEYLTRSDESYLVGNMIIKNTKPNYDNALTIYSSNLIDKKFSYNEHPISIINRSEGWKLSSNINGEDVYLGENADMVSQCAGYAMCMSIITGYENTKRDEFVEKMPATELYKECSALLNANEEIINCEQKDTIVEDTFKSLELTMEK